MKSEDALDVVIIIFLIAILLSVGLTPLVKERNRTEAYASSYVNDKNVKQAKITQDVFGENIDEYTLEDIFLTFQIQDYYMQQPKLLSVSYVNDAGKEVFMNPVSITSIYSGQRDIYCQWLDSFVTDYMLQENGIEDDKTKLRFKLELDTGESLSDTEDDFFVFKLIQ